MSKNSDEEKAWLKKTFAYLPKNDALHETPEDGFLTLMDHEPLDYPTYTTLDKMVSEIKAAGRIGQDTFTLFDLMQLVKAEKKDWELTAKTYDEKNPSWQVRRVLARRAFDYFTHDTRADHADVVIWKDTDGLNCVVVSAPEENSVRLYRNNLDIYIEHVQLYDDKIESMLAVDNEIQEYIDFQKKSKEENSDTTTTEDFEYHQETILETLAFFIAHWTEVAQRAKDELKEKEALENVLLCKTLFDKTKNESSLI